MRILILCTGNSCRSQMAEGFLKSFDEKLEVYSAGTKPAEKVHPLAVKVMAEVNIDISKNQPKSVEQFLSNSFDFVITVCGGANESCPTFTGKVANRWHIGFDDPAEAIGSEEEKLLVFRRVRNEISETFASFYKSQIVKKMDANAANNEKKKEIVREKYSQIAVQNETSGCCCDCGCGDNANTIDYTIFSENYSRIKGYNPDADLGLGCGLPTEFAKIKKGDTVVDLGSGAGNDCFVARAETGENGKVVGIDFTNEMVEKARENAAKLGFANVEFIKGDIENIPLESSSAEVVVSNCVLNLVPDKQKAFSEIYRILKSGGHFSISDVVLVGELPKKLREAAALYAGCVSGAIQKSEYINIIRSAGFSNISIQKEKQISIPDIILLDFLNFEELKNFKKSNTGIFSITVFGKKS